MGYAFSYHGIAERTCLSANHGVDVVELVGGNCGDGKQDATVAE
jgi:hypothetical protein